MKAAQTEPLQANHQFTPDAIGFIITFLIDQLAKDDLVQLAELESKPVRFEDVCDVDEMASYVESAAKKMATN